MSGGDDWTTPEVVRAVKKLVESVDRLEAASVQLRTTFEEKYVTKEMLAARLAPISEHRSQTREWVRDIVAPLLVGVVVAVIMFTLNLHR